MQITEMKDHLNKYKDALILVGPGAVNHIIDSDKQKLILTNKVLRREPDKFWDFFIKDVYVDTQIHCPSAAQEAIGVLDALGLVSKVVTLSTDGFFRAYNTVDSDRLIELHGSCQTVTCTSCKTVYPTISLINDKGIIASHECERCGKTLRPNILLFGETYNDAKYQELISELNKAHTVFTIGLDYTETPIIDLIASYCDLKAAQTDQEKILISVVDKELDMDLNNQIGFHEFIVKDDVNSAMNRFIKLLK